MKYGATVLGDGRVQFRAWAPLVQAMAVTLDAGTIQMVRDGEDFEVTVENVPGDADYMFLLDGAKQRPDPRSRWQPCGVHGASRVVNPGAFAWSDQDWKGIALSDYIFYELHTGTFTPEGTFEAIVSKLPYLKELGITALELMPVAEFPGSRNWGYDGVDLYAPHSAYGGPEGLRTLVNACHREGLAVVLDVVYNHLGPEGNYLSDFGPFFTDQYRTPWGSALNFDARGSDGVRQFFIDNALYWLTEYHIDALRLDAIHGIFDFGAFHILAEMAERCHETTDGFLIAESDLNDVRVIRPPVQGGHSLDAQWNDEFHHSLVSLLTGASHGFLSGYGSLKHLRKAIEEGFVYDGIYSPHRGRRFGSSSKNELGWKFTVFIQNHDQVANTAEGLRLSERVGFQRAKLAAALLFCTPSLPLLFMGEEFAETAPFLYFTSHTDPDLARAVSEGRRKEFAGFATRGEFADPQDPTTFEKSKIDWALLERPHHLDMLLLYRELIAIRKRCRALSNCRKDLTSVEINEDDQWLKLERSDPDGSRALLVCNFSERDLPFRPPEPYQLVLSTALSITGPTIDGHSACLFLLH